jgi:hypothetical protein
LRKPSPFRDIGAPIFRFLERGDEVETVLARHVLRQEGHHQQGTFALRFDLGGTLNRHVRLGAQIDGWLLEASDLWDPERQMTDPRAGYRMTQDSSRPPR